MGDYGATEGLYSRFHHGMVIENKTSEPRDLLMTERTTLSWIRFSTVLALGCCSVLLNYRFDTDSSSSDHGGDLDGRQSAFTVVVGILFALLSLACLVVPGYNYFKAVRSYASERIETAKTGPIAVLVTCSVVLLLTVNIMIYVKGDVK